MNFRKTKALVLTGASKYKCLELPANKGVTIFLSLLISPVPLLRDAS
jgi:hypothetical protein